jgi:hypothetical protein
MNKKWMIGIACAVMLVIVVVLVPVTSIYSAKNFAVTAEKGLAGQYMVCKNILSKYHKKMGELVQVPTMYKDDFKEIVTAEIQGKYGKDGSQAMFQFLKDREINFDSSMYKLIMQNVEIGQNEYANEQNILIDMIRAYATVVDKNLPLQRGWYMSFIGYPTVDTSIEDNKDFKIIIAKSANTVYETGEDAPMKLR